MDDLDIRDTGTMVFHLKRLGPLVSKNEKGEYILTSTGWKAYEILKEISGKTGPQPGDSGQGYGSSVEEAKKAGEPMAKASQQAQPWDVVGDVIILSDRIKLYVDRKLLENIRGRGKRLIIKDIVSLTISSDVDPELFEHTVLEIKDVAVIYAPESLRPYVELKARDYALAKYKVKITKPVGDLFSVFSIVPAVIGSIIPMVSETLSSVLSPPLLRSRFRGRSAGEHGVKPIYRKDLDQDIEKLEINISGGSLNIRSSDKPYIEIYSSRENHCVDGDYDVDIEGSRLYIELSGCHGELALPKRSIGVAVIDIAGGLLDIDLERGFNDLSIEMSGGSSIIKIRSMPQSRTRISVNGGIITLNKAYGEYDGEASIEISVNGGVVGGEMRLPSETRVSISEDEWGGISRINVDKDLGSVEKPKRIYRIALETLGGLVNIDIKKHRHEG